MEAGNWLSELFKILYNLFEGDAFRIQVVKFKLEILRMKNFNTWDKNTTLRNSLKGSIVNIDQHSFTKR